MEMLNLSDAQTLGGPRGGSPPINAEPRARHSGRDLEPAAGGRGLNDFAYRSSEARPCAAP